jgi:PAS domain S-box-containing protein
MENRAGSVSGRFLEDLLRALSRRRVDVGRLLVGLPVDREELREGHPQVPWDVFVELMSRLEFEVGGPRELQDLGECVTELKPAAILRRLAGLSASPLTLYRVAARWALRRAIPLLEHGIEVLDDGRVRVTAVIPAPHRPCPQLLHLAVGVLRAAPRILDLPPAVVHAEVQPSRARYSLVLPSSGTLGARVGRAVRALFSARAAFDQLEVQEGELQNRLVELQAAYAVLQESEGRHRALTDSAIDIITELGRDGRIQYMSPSLQEVTGHRPDELVESHFADWVHPEDGEALEREFQAALDAGGDGRSIFRARHQQGGWVWLEGEARRYDTSDGELRMVAILRNVNDRMALESERERHRQTLEQEVTRRTEQLERRNRDLRELQSLLLQAERLGTAQDLAGQIAHSINNPLGALIGNVQLALGEPRGREERLERMLELACRVRDVVSRTLELYREGKVNRSPENPQRILDEVANELEGRAILRNVELRVSPEPDLPRLETDRQLLISALVCVAENGIEAMEEGGELELGAGRARAESGSEAVEFRISDTGPGVPDALRETMFDPFITTKTSGTGLGLAIARGVVQGHGGRIQVSNRPGGGTTIRVEIPLAPRRD